MLFTSDYSRISSHREAVRKRDLKIQLRNFLGDRPIRDITWTLEKIIEGTHERKLDPSLRYVARGLHKIMKDKLLDDDQTFMLERMLEKVKEYPDNRPFINLLAEMGETVHSEKDAVIWFERNLSKKKAS